MAFNTYAQIKAGADAVAELIADHQQQLVAAKAVPASIVSSMTALGVQYGPLVAAVDALLAADPTDLGKQVLQSDIANLLDNFNAVRDAAQALDTLINPV